MPNRPSGRARLLQYLSDHLGEWVSNQTLRAVAGIDDVPRTIRNLRQQGWDIEVRGDGYNRLNTLEQQAGRGQRAAISDKLRYAVLHRSNHRCRACGRGVDDGIKLVVDHVIPVDWGGTNDPGNLQALCEECNHGKQAWVADHPPDLMRSIYNLETVEGRIEALFDSFPDQDIPSTMIEMISRNAQDWQRAVRRIRARTGKRIVPVQKRTAYRYETAQESAAYRSGS